MTVTIKPLDIDGTETSVGYQLHSDVKLPSKFSDGILLAIKDLEKIEASKNYDVVMSDWFVTSTITPAVCEVCLAGSVMHGTLGLDEKFIETMRIDYPFDGEHWPEGRVMVTPDEFDDKDLENKLEAFDSLRCGDISEALRKWYEKDPDVDETKFDCEYIKETFDENGYHMEWGSDTDWMSVYVEPYDEHAGKFKRDLREIARIFATIGF